LQPRETENINQNMAIVVSVAIILAVGACSAPAPATVSAPATPSAPARTSAAATTSAPTASPSPSPAPAAYSDPPSFVPSFLRCSASELKTPFVGADVFVITVFGLDNGKCHYAAKVVDKTGVALQIGVGIDCIVPKELITEDLLGHLFGYDKAPGREKTFAEQNKIETDYCKK